MKDDIKRLSGANLDLKALTPASSRSGFTNYVEGWKIALSWTCTPLDTYRRLSRSGIHSWAAAVMVLGGIPVLLIGALFGRVA